MRLEEVFAFRLLRSKVSFPILDAWFVFGTKGFAQHVYSVCVYNEQSDSIRRVSLKSRQNVDDPSTRLFEGYVGRML